MQSKKQLKRKRKIRKSKKVRKSNKVKTFKQKGGDNTAYVINLDKRSDRMSKIIADFPSLNIQRVPAITADPGFVGCGLSHIKTIKMAKDMNLPSILIMEDDAIPTESFSNWPKIKIWLDNNTDKWDVYLGGNSYYGMYYDVIDIEPICSLDTVKLYKGKGLTTHFIYINSIVYDTFLDWENHKDSPIDLWLNSKNMRVISSVPFIALQNSTYSNVEKRDINYDNFFKDSEAFIGKVENNQPC